MFLYIAGLIISVLILTWLSSHLIKSLISVARYFHIKEFIVAFFIMSVAGSLSNLFVDINASLQGMPHLALGDILGGNLVDITLVIAIAILLSKKPISASSRMVQTSAIYTAVIAILPLFLVFDGNLNRIDGVILIGTFFAYVLWLFSKAERFKKEYATSKKQKPIVGFSGFIKNLFKIILLLVLLLVVSQVVISSAQYFSDQLGVSLSMVGILIIGLVNCFPELYFSFISARKGEGYMILGELMGSVIVCATLVMGMVAIIAPFEIKDFSPFLIARAFTIIAAIFFLWAVRSDKKLTKKEGLFLLGLYILFLLAEVFKAYLF